MSGLKFEFEWQDPGGVRGPELASTWARFEARLDEVWITECQDLRAQTVRKGIYIPLYPIAEWLASNWWSLWFEDRARPTSTSFERHALGTAREGFALPDARLWPEGGELLIEVQPTEHPHAALRFFGRKIVRVPAVQVREEATRLIEAVLERLRSAGIRQTPLEEEWQLIANTNADPAQGAFCEYAARLGFDPYAVPDEDAEAIEQARRDLPPAIAADFFDAAQPANLIETARALAEVLLEARKVAEAGSLSRWRQADAAKMPPHQQGYREAREVRTALGLNGNRFQSVREVAASFRLPPPDDLTPGPFDAVAAVSAADTPVFLLSPRPEPSRLFAYCRALGEALRLDQAEPMILTRGKSARQKRSRAFAAEFLAPADQIRKALGSAVAGDEECEELGAAFGVSSMVIRHQIEDHGIAEYAGASYSGQ